LVAFQKETLEKMDCLSILFLALQFLNLMINFDFKITLHMASMLPDFLKEY